MQAEKEPPPPPPLALPPEPAGLLPHAVRASATAATPVRATPVRFICTDLILSRSGLLRPAVGATTRRSCRSGHPPAQEAAVHY
jgi:hypothetical protein